MVTKKYRLTVEENTRLALFVALEKSRNGSPKWTLDDWQAKADECIGLSVPRKRLRDTLTMAGVTFDSPIPAHITNHPKEKTVSKDKIRYFAQIMLRMAREIGYEFPVYDLEVMTILATGEKWKPTQAGA